MSRLSSRDEGPVDGPVEDAAAAAVTDERRSSLLDRLGAEFGDALVDTRLDPGIDVWARIATDAWLAAGMFVRDALDCEYFDYLSAIDWLPSPFGKGEDDPTAAPAERSTELRHGVTGGETRFQLIARVLNLRTHVGLTLKVDVPDDSLAVESWVPVFAGANWHERETWEMFGITFLGHPHLRKLYLPGDFEGHPLRKDFPLLARMVKPWPGIVDVEPMPGEPEGDAESTESTEVPA